MNRTGQHMTNLRCLLEQLAEERRLGPLQSGVLLHQRRCRPLDSAEPAGSSCVSLSPSISPMGTRWGPRLPPRLKFTKRNFCESLSSDWELPLLEVLRERQHPQEIHWMRFKTDEVLRYIQDQDSIFLMIGDWSPDKSCSTVWLALWIASHEKKTQQDSETTPNHLNISQTNLWALIQLLLCCETHNGLRTVSPDTSPAESRALASPLFLGKSGVLWS